MWFVLKILFSIKVTIEKKAMILVPTWRERPQQRVFTLLVIANSKKMWTFTTLLFVSTAQYKNQPDNRVFVESTKTSWCV